MNSSELAKYIEMTNGISKPWLLAQLRMQKLQERRHELTQEEYLLELEDLHRDVMSLGEWWKGIEDQVF